MLLKRFVQCFATVAIALAVAEPMPAAAQEVYNSVAKANVGTVGIVSGGVDGTYIRIASDLSAVLDDGDRLRVIPVVGKGSLQNIADILFLRGIDVGIVQSDVLAYARRNRLYPGIDQSIQYITKLYEEEVHVLARNDISELKELADQPVNVDVRGSGTAMTASVLFDSLHIAVQARNDDQATAMDKLKRGEIAALVYVSGKPARLFSSVEAVSGLHLLPVPIADTLLDTYLPSQFTHADYPQLVPDGESCDTIAVGSVLATFAWQPGHERFKKVARFVESFFSNFPKFTQPPRHPKWRDVNLAAQVPGWTRFGPAQDWLSRQAQVVAAEGTQQRQFGQFLPQIGGPASLSPAQKDALFKEFLSWQGSRGHVIAR